MTLYYRLRSAFKRRLLRPLVRRASKLVPERVQDVLGLNIESPQHSPLALEKKLWAGHSQQALQDLHWIITGRRMLAGTRADAAWVLARWHAARAEHALSLQYVLLMQALAKSHQWEKGPVLVQVDSLNRLGRADEALRVIEPVVRQQGELPDYCLAYANILCAQGQSDEARLSWINRIYRVHGFAELGLREASQSLAIDNLMAIEPLQLDYHDGPKVTVLMPAYNSAETIEKSIRGLLAQTWKNLEIIPVDDCSTDDTWNVLQAFAEQDERVVPIRHEVNTGAYGARLTGLAQASGDFITVHDADDWSHPQKIETQIQALLADDSLVACMSSWCRVSRNLYVNRVGAIPGPNLQRQNESSLMFRRSLVESLGAWDRVRAAADTEFIWRIEAAYGRQAVKVVHDDVPLSFSLSQEDSLTQTGPTHVKTIFYGTRRVYREAQKWWHRHAAQEELKIAPEGMTRRFPAPPNLLRRNPGPEQYDLLLVADFSLGIGVGEYVRGLVLGAVEAGYRIALFHWRRYEKPAMRPMRDEYYALAADGKVALIAAEDKLQAKCAIVIDPMVGRHLLDRLPEWKVLTLMLTTGHEAASNFPVGVYEPSLIEANMTQAFRKRILWLPVSNEDLTEMQSDPRYEHVASAVLEGPGTGTGSSLSSISLANVVDNVESFYNAGEVTT